MSHLDRVKTERNELSDKLRKLEAFIYEDSGVFDSLTKSEQVLLIRQAAAMNEYLKVLDTRLWKAHNA